MGSTPVDARARKARRIARNHRVFLRVVGKPYVRALVLPFFAILLSAAMLDATVDWTRLKGRIAAAEPWQTAAICGGLFVGWGLTAGRALRPIWRQPFIAFLVRQPLRDSAWAAYLLPSLVIALIPVVFASWLLPRHVNVLIHYAGFTALVIPVLLGASYRGRESAVLVPGASAIVMICVWLYLKNPLTAFAALGVAAIATKFAVRPIRKQVSAVRGNVYSPLDGSGAIVTIARRDLRCLMRRQWKNLTGLAVLSILCAAMMLAFRINGELQGREALLSACVFLTIATTPVYELLESLKTGLGREIMRRRWPVTLQQRSFALLTLIAILLGFAAFSILLFASSMGAANGLVYVLFAAVTVTGSAALLSVMLLAQRSGNGWFLLFVTGHLITILALPPWLYAASAVAFLPFGFRMIRQGFDRFTFVTERLSLEQLA